LNIDESAILVQMIHYPLLLVQAVNVGLLLSSFDRSRFGDAL
jgi:hypothetical protein